MAAFGDVDAGTEGSDDFSLQIPQDAVGPGNDAPFAVPGQNLHIRRAFCGRPVAGDRLLKPDSDQFPVLRRDDGIDPVLAEQFGFRIAEYFLPPLVEHGHPRREVQRHQQGARHVQIVFGALHGGLHRQPQLLLLFAGAIQQMQQERQQ